MAAQAQLAAEQQRAEALATQVPCMGFRGKGPKNSRTPRLGPGMLTGHTAAAGGVLKERPVKR